MKHDTSQLGPDEWRSTIPPAEAATEVGADTDPDLIEGAAIAFLFVAACALVATLLAVHMLASWLGS